MYPFLYRSIEKSKYFVQIATFDYVDVDTGWMKSTELNNVLMPFPDIENSLHEFNNEAEAIEFIRNWWK